jgi:hypothetical protein
VRSCGVSLRCEGVADTRRDRRAGGDEQMNRTVTLTKEEIDLLIWLLKDVAIHIEEPEHVDHVYHIMEKLQPTK